MNRNWIFCNMNEFPLNYKFHSKQYYILWRTRLSNESEIINVLSIQRKSFRNTWKHLIKIKSYDNFLWIICIFQFSCYKLKEFRKSESLFCRHIEYLFRYEVIIFKLLRSNWIALLKCDIFVFHLIILVGSISDYLSIEELKWEQRKINHIRSQGVIIQPT